MNNLMVIENHRAVISYDPEIEMFRGEFTDLSGGADFYAKDIAGLKREAKRSLNTYLAVCKEQGIAPYKKYSGKFSIRTEPALH